MAAGKMTIEYLLKILAEQEFIDKSKIYQYVRDAEEVVRDLKGSRPRSREGGADEAPDPVDVLVSLELPLFEGKEGQYIASDDIMKAVAVDNNLAYRKIDPLELDLEVVTKTLPQSFALKHFIVPIGIIGNSLEVAIADPFSTWILDDVRRVTTYSVVPVISTREDIKKLISEFYGFKRSIAGAQDQLGAPMVDFNNLEQYVRVKSISEIHADDEHVRNAVDYLIGYAFENRVSDIHIEPKRSETLVRMRIDGVLHNLHRLPKKIHSAIISRIKSVSRLDIAEKRRPQDGRIKIDRGGKEAEIRVSTIPVVFGEKAVLRFLDPDVLFRDLNDLLIFKPEADKYNQFISQPHGIILVTGPTGSGKSTTLYSTLLSLAGEEKNVTTVEDPIEMVHEDFNQIAVQPQIGITFGSILRNILRQDPDVIMIGETRDFETAENAIQAALTGHLVLTTLHTNDAPSAITRLIDLGVEPFLVASTVAGVVAQRLLRKICPFCAEEFYLNQEEVDSLGLRVKTKGRLKLRRGLGCEKCRFTGYLGRVATVEVMPMSEKMAQLTMSGSETGALKKTARSEGMSTLRENALRLMLKGLTTFQEILRVTAEE